MIKTIYDFRQTLISMLFEIKCVIGVADTGLDIFNNYIQLLKD